MCGLVCVCVLLFIVVYSIKYTHTMFQLAIALRIDVGLEYDGGTFDTAVPALSGIINIYRIENMLCVNRPQTVSKNVLFFSDTFLLTAYSMSDVYFPLWQVRTKRTKRTANERILYIFLLLFNVDVYTLPNPWTAMVFPLPLYCAEQVGHLISASAYVSIKFSFNSILLLIIILCSLCCGCLYALFGRFESGLCVIVWHFQHRKKRKRRKKGHQTRRTRRIDFCVRILSHAHNQQHIRLCDGSSTKRRPFVPHMLWLHAFRCEPMK